MADNIVPQNRREAQQGLSRHLSLNNLLILALLLALLSSLRHVAFAFSTVNGENYPEAYISAIAIDVGMLALAAGINQRKQQRRSTWPMWAGVAFFSLISIYANWLSGLAHVQAMSGNSDIWLVTLRPILLSAVLPILVIYLSEIVSGNHGVDKEAAERAAKRHDKVTTAAQPATKPAAAPVAAGDKPRGIVAERRQRVLSLVTGGVPESDIAEREGVSIRTVQRDIVALNGKVKR